MGMVVMYKEMELLMRGYIATDGNFANQAGRTFSARNKERTAAARSGTAYKPASASSTNNTNAYSLPEGFDRLSSIVSQDDVENWMTSNEQQYDSGQASNAPARRSSYYAAQTAYGQQTSYSKQMQTAQQQAQGQQTTSSVSDAAGTKEQTAILNDGTLTDEEIALLEEEEKKGSRSYGFNESDIDHMNSLLESMKRARERNKANNEKKTKAKKVLRYQFKRISGTISKAKSVKQAGDAVFTAKNSLISIRRKGASGKYDPNEIAMAETHARKMVRIAKVKLAHMKQEEASEDYGSKDEVSVEFRKLIKKSHRKEEDMELLKADMDYLKAQIKYIKSGGSTISGTVSSAAAAMNTAVEAAYIMKKEALKENLQEFLENSEFDGTAYEMTTGIADAVSNAPVSAGGTIAASSVAAAAPIPSGGFTTMM